MFFWVRKILSGPDVTISQRILFDLEWSDRGAREDGSSPLWLRFVSLLCSVWPAGEPVTDTLIPGGLAVNTFEGGGAIWRIFLEERGVELFPTKTQTQQKLMDGGGGGGGGLPVTAGMRGKGNVPFFHEGMQLSWGALSQQMCSSEPPELPQDVRVLLIVLVKYGKMLEQDHSCTT